jgi:hypothetical protein
MFIVYPKHRADTLCGKGLSEVYCSSIGAEKASNWSLQAMLETDFENNLIADQAIMPKYFGYDVALNKKEAAPFASNIAIVNKMEKITCKACLNRIETDVIIIDVRPQALYKEGHFGNRITLQISDKFETWLRSIIAPNEALCLAADTKTQIKAAFLG